MNDSFRLSDLLPWPALAVVLTLLMLLSLRRVARRQRGWTVALVGLVFVLVATVASSMVLWTAGLVLSLALDGSAVWSAMVSLLLNIVIHLLIWSLVAAALVRQARAGQ